MFVNNYSLLSAVMLRTSSFQHPKVHYVQRLINLRLPLTVTISKNAFLLEKLNKSQEEKDVTIMFLKF